MTFGSSSPENIRPMSMSGPRPVRFDIVLPRISRMRKQKHQMGEKIKRRTPTQKGTLPHLVL